jgi:uncharacterized protein YkwD
MKTKLNLLAIAVSMTLTACGGGGGGTTPLSTSPSVVTTPPVGTTPPVATSPSVTPANLQASVPAPTYLAGSAELDAYVEFSGFRRMMGLGPVAQNSKIDVAAQNHSAYIVLYQNIVHTEDSSKTGFTGATPADRLSFAQYSGNFAGEVVGVARGKFGVRGLMNSVYHRDGLTFQGMTEVGISYNGGWSFVEVMDFGRIGLGQNNASDFSTTYPVANQTDLPLTMLMEVPNPFPDLANTFDVYSKNTSSPVTVYSETNTTLNVVNFSVTEDGQPLPLDVRLITKQNDVNALVAKNVAHIVGKVPFKANTKYNVSFSGNINGVALLKNWSFTTGTSVNVGGGAQ